MLCLASSSPRRSLLLEQAGIEFELVKPGEEPVEKGVPEVVALERAVAKAEGAVAFEGALVLGVDTVVDLEGEELGKATSEDEAWSMLARLRGRVHRVHTGHCLARVGGERWTCVATARVRFEVCTDSVLEAYLASGEWRGKAGAYGIQDEACGFAALVEGELDTVVGLSIRALRQLLSEAQK